MATRKPFPHADFLSQLEQLSQSRPSLPDPPLSPLLSGILLASDARGELTDAAGHLIQFGLSQFMVVGCHHVADYPQ